MKREITETEWELIQAIRNYRGSRHNPSRQLEVYIDTLTDTLKFEEDI